ncbi:MAG: hypothetical protein ACREIA_27240 [Opitutaceae bacterium]
MKKLLNNPWIAGALALIAIVAVTSTLHKGGASGRRAAFAGTEDLDLVEQDASETGELTPSAIRKIVLGLSIPETLPDPFASAESKAFAAAPQAAETERVHLSGIWNQAGETLVLINNRILRAGETIGRVSIESADLDGVWLTHPKGREFLALGAEFTLVIAPGSSALKNTDVALHEN